MGATVGAKLLYLLPSGYPSWLWATPCSGRSQGVLSCLLSSQAWCFYDDFFGGVAAAGGDQRI